MTSPTEDQDSTYGGPLIRLILGVDFGTTFSGVSYALTSESGVESIKVIQNWPACPNSTAAKVPTRIAYARENSSMLVNQWGFNVTPETKSYSWTKLQLDSNAEKSDYDDPSIVTMTGQNIIALPPFRNAAGVCEDYLREIWTFTQAYLRDNPFKEFHALARNTPVECWITLPAIWSDEAKDATLQAAKNAGFANGAQDEIFTIAEPEAAALAVLAEYTRPSLPNAIKAHEHILICDCGGGTVDVTTYTVTQTEPRLQFEELCIGVGGKCGSTYIDRNFHTLLSERFGQAFDNVPYTQKGPGSAFMMSFEEVKCTFGCVTTPTRFEVGHLHMNTEPSDGYEVDESMVVLSHEDMKGLFDPVVDQILRLVQDQVGKVKIRRGAQIDRLILVGGFGGSVHLQSRIREWCIGHGNMMLLCPEDPQAAIVKGAALRGLEGIVPRLKYSRRHYGFVCGLRFRPGRDNERHSFICLFENTKYCSGRMSWSVAKGESVFKGTYRAFDIYSVYTPGEVFNKTLNLYSSVSDDSQDRFDNPAVDFVGSINTKFPADHNFGSALESTYNSRLKKMVYRINYTVEVVFGDKGDNLQFRTMVNGVASGTTYIVFSRG